MPAEISHNIPSNLKHPYNLTVNAFAFTPLQLVSPKAEELVARKAAELAQLPQGSPQCRLLAKQLELMRGAGVDLEFYLTANAMGTMPDSERAYVILPANLAHPWSRGTVVRPPLPDLSQKTCL